jgi:uncharacterized SAM-binding protein YcdF (DUF218 family)
VFFWLSKRIDVLVSPFTWALAAAAVAVVLAARRRTAGAALAAVALALLAGFGSPAVASRLSAWVEAPARPSYVPGTTYDVVVVLSGMVDGPASRASGETELSDKADRIVRGFELLRSGAARHVLLSGGPAPDGPSEADRLAAKLVAWGIAPDRIVVEPRSTNTHENAVESARLIAQRGWRRVLLVTSAAHMPRAAGCFHAVGLRPDTLPVDHHASHAGAWFPSARALATSAEALHELAGRIVYRVVGYASDDGS